MIFDRLNNHQFYPLGTAWREAFRFLIEATPEIKAGKYHLRGDDLFAIVMDYQTQPLEELELEAHRRYLDIQVLLAGREAVACHFVPDLRILHPYDPDKDAEIYQIPNAAPARFVLTPGLFLAFYPHDAHLPCLMVDRVSESVKKVVVKVAVASLT